MTMVRPRNRQAITKVRVKVKRWTTFAKILLKRKDKMARDGSL